MCRRLRHRLVPSRLQLLFAKGLGLLAWNSLFPARISERLSTSLLAGPIAPTSDIVPALLALPAYGLAGLRTFRVSLPRTACGPLCRSGTGPAREGRQRRSAERVAA